MNFGQITLFVLKLPGFDASNGDHNEMGGLDQPHFMDATEISGLFPQQTGKIKR